MTMENYTHIEVVLDRSGSMATIHKDMIGGFNSFLADQKKVPGKATISLTQFDDKYEPNYSFSPLDAAPNLTEDTYVPRGSTALHDAMGQTIQLLGERLKAMKDEQRPAKVIMLIITDGMENASRRYNAMWIAAMVKHQREKYGWDFVFLGANQDAVLTAAHLGIQAQGSVTWNASAAGSAAAYVNTSQAIADSRMTGRAVQYSDQQRAAIENTGKVNGETKN